MKSIRYLIILLLTFNISFAQTSLDTALNFSVKDIYGNNIELFSLLDDDKIVLIEFFSTSCGPCALYAPEVQASYEDFGENTGNVYIMGICWGDDNQGVAYFDSIYGVTHPTVSGSQGGGNGVYTNYEIQSTPTVILIAPDRTILEHWIWKPTQENINAAIIAAGGSMVGIDDEPLTHDEDILIYPNPASDRVNVQLEVQDAAIYQLEIYNLSGTRIHQSSSARLTAGKRVLSAELGDLPEGTYFIRIIRNGQHESLDRLILID